MFKTEFVSFLKMIISNVHNLMCNSGLPTIFIVSIMNNLNQISEMKPYKNEHVKILNSFDHKKGIGFHIYVLYSFAADLINIQRKIKS